MPIFPFISVVALFCFLFHTKVVGAEQVVRFIFNNGVSPSAGTCSSQDNSKIDLVFYVAPGAVRRRLRSTSADVMTNVLPDSSTIDDLKNYTSVSRDLQTSASKCKNACAGYATGTCHAATCKGVRRELNDKSSDYHNRKLQTDKCNSAITWINNELNKLISTNAITTSCQSFIAAPKRASSCYEETVYGQIEAIKFWNVAVPSSPKLMATFSADSTLPLSSTWTTAQKSGFSFCQSQKFTIEAITNECVEVVQFFLRKNWITIHESYTYTRPFTLYSLNANKQMNGANLPPGEYVIDSKPDWWVSRERRFIFTVLNC